MTLHSSWVGIGLSFGGALIFGLIAVVLFVQGAPVILSVGFAVVAFAAALVVLLDVPIATEFSADGVTRGALVRHQNITWDRVTRVSRTRVGVVRTVRESAGGLVAEVGRRRYLLVDKRESPAEFDAVRSVVGGEVADRLGLTNELRPADGTSPTWLYRRKKWRPIP